MPTRKSSQHSAEELIPPRPTLTSLRAAATDCTVHPSSILRAPDDETRRLEHRRFIDDLKKLAKVIE